MDVGAHALSGRSCLRVILPSGISDLSRDQELDGTLAVSDLRRFGSARISNRVRPTGSGHGRRLVAGCGDVDLGLGAIYPAKLGQSSGPASLRFAHDSDRGRDLLHVSGNQSYCTANAVSSCDSHFGRRSRGIDRRNALPISIVASARSALVRDRPGYLVAVLSLAANYST